MPDAMIAARRPPELPALPDDSELSVKAMPHMGRLVLRCGEAIAVRAGAVLGMAIPCRPLASAVGGRASALWLGPDEWLLLTGEGEAEGVAGELAAGLEGLPHSLVDVSHRQMAFSVEGRLAARVLSSGCPLDLGPQAFTAGTVARTLFHKAEIVLWRAPAAKGFHLEVWRSFAPYVVGHLAVARRGAEGLPDAALPR